MRSKKTILRSWNEVEDDKILRLFREELGDHSASYADCFNWQYRLNPAGKGTICCAQSMDDAVVSFYATIPIPMLFRGIKVTGSLSLQTLTHSDFRRQGLFTKCATKVYEALKEANIALTYGFPNKNSYPGLIRKLAFADIGHACLLIRPYEPAAVLARKIPAARWLGLAGFDRLLARCLLKQPRQKVDIKVRTSFEGIPLEHLREEAELVIDIDTDWLNWRYFEAPRREYRLIVAGGEAKPDGVAVYRILDWRNIRIGTVNDLFLSRDCSPDTVESLMHHVFNECRAQGCAAVFSLVSPTSRKLKMLQKAGFWIVPPRMGPQPFAVILRGHTVSVSDIRIKDMEVSFGVYDVF